MPAELFRRAGPQPAEPPRTPDPAFAARPRLLHLRDALSRGATLRPERWNEPAVFFFDPTRQAELEAARPAAHDRFAALAELVAAELPALLEHVEVRRVARTLGGLKDAALALAPHCAAANDLADLLAVPDDEVFLALAPGDRSGVRLHVRGAARVAQLHRLLAPSRADSSFQLFAPAALLPDGTLPVGFAGCGHWLWPEQPLAAVPRINGERVVLVGPAVVRTADAESRFPGMTAEAEVVQTLNAFQVADELSRLVGRAVPVSRPAETANAGSARAA